MNRPTLAFVLSILTLTGSLDARAAEGPGTGVSSTTLDEVNLALTSRVATIVLASGNDIARATGVLVGPETIAFTAAGRRQTLPTSQVVRIRTQRKGKFLRAFGLGLGVGAGGGLTLVNSCARYFCPSPTEIVVGAAVVGGVIGGLVGAFRHAEPGAVVFEGPVTRYIAGPAETDAARKARELSRRLFGSSIDPSSAHF